MVCPACANFVLKLSLLAKEKDTDKKHLCHLRFHIQLSLKEKQLHHLHPYQIGKIHLATKVSGGVSAFENHTVFLHVVDKKKNVQKFFHKYLTNW